VRAVRHWFAAFVGQSERTILLYTILLAGVVSAMTFYILTQYYTVDVLSSLFPLPQDCWPALHWGYQFGRHCWGDYSWQVTFALRPNPWVHVGAPNLPDNPYPPAAMMPYMVFGLFAHWVGAPKLGLFGYLFALVGAILSAALWAARGARGLERLMVFLALGMAPMWAWMAVDRGNSTGFVVPIALVFLVALCRQRWGLVTITVVLAALLKPQLVVLAVMLFAARRWRLGGLAVGGFVVGNLAGYLLWPRDFPGTIAQSIQMALSRDPVSGQQSFDYQLHHFNVSFGRAFLLIPDWIKASGNGGVLPDGFLFDLRSSIGFVVLVIIAVSVVVLGRRMPPVMAGIVLLAAASLFPAVSLAYYLVFAVPVAALIVRDPDGPPGAGIFDRLRGRRVVGICVSLAAAFSIMQIALPHTATVLGIFRHAEVIWLYPPSYVETTLPAAPVLWLMACAVILVSYARKPDGRADNPSAGSATADSGGVA
jgi:Glycosyltransferase family 87